jgi:hypothetical protein
MNTEFPCNAFDKNNCKYYYQDSYRLMYRYLFRTSVGTLVSWLYCPVHAPYVCSRLGSFWNSNEFISFERIAILVAQ